jgi:hypothetical protein
MHSREYVEERCSSKEKMQFDETRAHIASSLLPHCLSVPISDQSHRSLLQNLKFTSLHVRVHHYRLPLDFGHGRRRILDIEASARRHGGRDGNRSATVIATSWNETQGR